mmetsp:Transcript_34057/g.82480  ORF Transcript_34057/g.82480 Transcript_34057/m.82480 type:complete len:128 (-) Transcript_34057:101-484(-)
MATVVLSLAEFKNNARCLWNAEVSVILESRLDKETTNRYMMGDILAYVNKFKNFKSRSDVQEAREFATKKENEGFPIHDFELAIINNCGISSEEEARELLPTLHDKFVNRGDELQKFLDDLNGKHSG